jgi:hypothetical protein
MKQRHDLDHGAVSFFARRICFRLTIIVVSTTENSARTNTVQNPTNEKLTTEQLRSLTDDERRAYIAGMQERLTAITMQAPSDDSAFCQCHRCAQCGQPLQR